MGILNQILAILKSLAVLCTIISEVGKKFLRHPCYTSKDFDIIFYSETLLIRQRHISELLIPELDRLDIFLQSSIPRALGLAVYACSGFSAPVI